MTVERFGRFSREELRRLLADGRDTMSVVRGAHSTISALWKGPAGARAGGPEAELPGIEGTLHLFLEGREHARFHISSRTRGVAGRVGSAAAEALKEDVPELRAFVELLQELAGPGYTAEFVRVGAEPSLEHAGALVGALLRSVGVDPPQEQK